MKPPMVRPCSDRQPPPISRAQRASDEALAASHGVLRDGDADGYLQRLRAQLERLQREGELGDGEHIVQVQRGGQRLPIVVRVQADLFGPPSINIDSTSLDASST